MAMTDVALCLDEAEYQGVQQTKTGYALIDDAVIAEKVLKNGTVQTGFLDFIAQKMKIKPPVKIAQLNMDQFYLYLGSGTRSDWFAGELRYSGHSQYMTHDGNGGITEYNTFGGWTNPNNRSPQYVILYRHAIPGGQ